MKIDTTEIHRVVSKNPDLTAKLMTGNLRGVAEVLLRQVIESKGPRKAPASLRYSRDEAKAHIEQLLTEERSDPNSVSGRARIILETMGKGDAESFVRRQSRRYTLTATLPSVEGTSVDANHIDVYYDSDAQEAQRLVDLGILVPTLQHEHHVVGGVFANPITDEFISLMDNFYKSMEVNYPETEFVPLRALYEHKRDAGQIWRVRYFGSEGAVYVTGAELMACGSTSALSTTSGSYALTREGKELAELFGELSPPAPLPGFFVEILNAFKSSPYVVQVSPLPTDVAAMVAAHEGTLTDDEIGSMGLDLCELEETAKALSDQEDGDVTQFMAVYHKKVLDGVATIVAQMRMRGRA